VSFVLFVVKEGILFLESPSGFTPAFENAAVRVKMSPKFGGSALREENGKKREAF
jgi:hypothetical protein